jgi:hypothetical protein
MCREEIATLNDKVTS